MEYNLTTLLSIYSAESSTINTLWALYVAVSGGILGIVFTAKKISSFNVLALLFVYLVFSYATWKDIYRAQTHLSSAASLIHSEVWDRNLNYSQPIKEISRWYCSDDKRQCNTYPTAECIESPNFLSVFYWFISLAIAAILLWKAKVVRNAVNKVLNQGRAIARRLAQR